MSKPLDVMDHFHGYYQPTEEEVNQLWDEAIYVFDANILLNIC
jgi:hypothetical protein